MNSLPFSCRFFILKIKTQIKFDRNNFISKEKMKTYGFIHVKNSLSVKVTHAKQCSLRPFRGCSNQTDDTKKIPTQLRRMKARMETVPKNAQNECTTMMENVKCKMNEKYQWMTGCERTTSNPLFSMRNWVAYFYKRHWLRGEHLRCSNGMVGLCAPISGDSLSTEWWKWKICLDLSLWEITLEYCMLFHVTAEFGLCLTSFVMRYYFFAAMLLHSVAAISWHRRFE